MIIPEIRAGRAVTLKWQLTDQTVDPPVPVTPPLPPVITVLDPVGNAHVNGQSMIQVIGPDTLPVVGLYYYTFPVPVAGPVGTWTTFVDATDENGYTSGSIRLESFQVVN
jgi:hypothetical protein